MKYQTSLCHSACRFRLPPPIDGRYFPLIQPSLQSVLKNVSRPVPATAVTATPSPYSTVTEHTQQAYITTRRQNTPQLNSRYRHIYGEKGLAVTVTLESVPIWVQNQPQALRNSILFCISVGDLVADKRRIRRICSPTE